MNAKQAEPVAETPKPKVKTTQDVLAAEVEQILAQRILRLPELKNRPVNAKVPEEGSVVMWALAEIFKQVAWMHRASGPLRRHV